MRFLALALGAGLLFWLPVEDTHERWVILFSSAASAWGAAYVLTRLPPVSPVRRRSFLLRCLLVGLLAGLAVAPLALGLMIFKTGLHSHGTPDFTIEQVASVLQRAPYFGISGLLLGLGSALVIFAKIETLVRA
jgi:hypothetical protein